MYPQKYLSIHPSIHQSIYLPTAVNQYICISTYFSIRLSHPLIDSEVRNVGGVTTISTATLPATYTTLPPSYATLPRATHLHSHTYQVREGPREEGR